jgi:hypothetical protein
MIAKLRTSHTTTLADPPIRESRSAARSADMRPTNFAIDPETNISRRRMRNRFILANAIAWFAIIVAVRLIFF